MKRICVFKWILIVFTITGLQEIFAQDFTIYNSWDFENDELGEYTQEDTYNDFEVYPNFAYHTGVSIANNTINGEQTKVLKAFHPANQLWQGFQMNAYYDESHTGYDEVYMSYNMKFDKNWNSTAGGKISGLRAFPPIDPYPLDEQGFYCAPMFKYAGRIISYHYDRTVPPPLPWSYEPYDYDTVFFSNGVWYNVTQRIVRNTFTEGVPNADGINEIWVDGHLVFQETNLKLEALEINHIDGFFLGNYYGGDDTVYMPLHDSYVYLDNIAIWVNENDPTYGTQSIHDPDEILQTPVTITDREVNYDHLVSSEGTIHNTNYGNVPGCSDETWLIDAGPGNTVSLNITAGATGGGDYLFFYDGNQTDSPIIEIIPGYDETITGTQSSTGRYMFIRYSANRDGGFIGFIGTISFENNNITENNPPEINNQLFTIYEDNFKNDSVGYVIATETDPGQSVTLSIISGNESGLFNLNAFSGELKTTTGNTIFEMEPDQYLLSVRATDDGEGNLSDEAIITITVEKHEDVVYIDPNNKNDGLEDGTIEHPYDSWQDVEWISGFSYKQLRGTVAPESKISILANDVSLGAYGESGDLPVIWSTAEDYALSCLEKSDITIREIQVVAEYAISSAYFLGDNSDNIIVENSKFEGSIYGIRIIGGNSFTIRYNIFRGNSEAVYSYANDTKVYYNIFQNNQNALYINGNDSFAEIYNNVFYDNNTAVTNEYSELTLYNNIFYLTKDFDKALNLFETVLVSDYNIYYPMKEGFIELNSDEFDDLFDLQQIEGIDINSFVSDPLFVDAFNHNFALENTSPAIDAGIYVGITADLTGGNVPVGNNPDIGVIEIPGIATASPAITGNLKYPIDIYPNPCDGIFNISFNNLKSQEATINIQDINGHIIFTKLYSQLETRFDHTLDISEYPSGIYILSLKAASDIYSLRISKTL